MKNFFLLFQLTDSLVEVTVKLLYIWYNGENEPEASTSINDYETLEMKEDEFPSELEIYELFMNGELTVEKKDEQLTINDLFWDNDIEYCFLDIDGDEYALIYVDDDAIPELVGGMPLQVVVVSFRDGNVRAMECTRGLEGIKYMEYGGRFYSEWDNFFDVYMLEKGEFSSIGLGNFSERHYKYFWDGRVVTETEYEACINELIDISECIEPSEIYTKVEILERLAEQENARKWARTSFCRIEKFGGNDDEYKNNSCL